MILVCLFTNGKAQSTLDSSQLNKEFFSLDEALKNPINVYRLDLSNQNIDFSDTMWSIFTNLQYLSLKNDHLKEIPSGSGYLKSLTVLDLSGNDFTVLPSTFVNLVNLKELYINDDKYFQFDKNIPILMNLPNLISLHVENDGLTSLPKDVFRLSHLESLYLNNNQFKNIPIELKELKTLKYLDLHDNKFKLPTLDIQDPKYNFKIGF
jgi:Leucine-rich repeat (LRR) protein